MAFWHSAMLLVEKVNGFRSEKFMNDEEIDVLQSSESKDGCFDKIIDPDTKQVGFVHGSHVVALSQVFPNNVNGGTLTPLDLGDVSSNQDSVSRGYQGTHSGGLGLANQGGIQSIHPPLNSSFQAVQGSPTMGITNNMTSTPEFNSPRDARLSGVRPESLHIHEQQRLQQYNHLLSRRSVQSAKGNSVGVLGSTHGNPMFSPRDGLEMTRPGQSLENQRQMTVPEMQTHGTHDNSSVVTSLSHVRRSPHLQGPNHPTPKQQSILRMKEKRLQHRQHHQHLPSSSASLTRVHTSPISPPLKCTSSINSHNLKPYTNTVAETVKQVQRISSSAGVPSNEGVSSAAMPSLVISFKDT